MVGGPAWWSGVVGTAVLSAETSGAGCAGAAAGPRSARDRTTPPVASGTGGPMCSGRRAAAAGAIGAAGAAGGGTTSPPRSSWPESRPPVSWAPAL